MMGEVRCPRCGRRTSVRTAREDDHKYYVCINYPYCKGRVPIEEIWGKGRPVSELAYDRPRKRITPYPPGHGGGTAVRKPGKGKLEFDLGRNRPGRRARAAFDEVWGDDWDEGKPAPKSAPYRPQYEKALKRQAASEIEELPRPRQQRAPEAAREKPRPRIKADTPRHGTDWGGDWGDETPAVKAVADKPRPTASKAAQERSQQRRVPEVADDKPRQQIAPKKVSLKKKKSSRSWWRRVLKKEAAPAKKGPSKPRSQIVSKEEVVLQKKELPKPQQQSAPRPASYLPLYEKTPQRYLAPERKKRSLAVTIVALVIAFIALDGMIYAAFVLR